MGLGTQAVTLLLLALPIASISWTVTHEELFREPREFCQRCSEGTRSWLLRKVFYIFTCEYCFSHYVTVAFLALTRFHLIYSDWRGYLVGGFALVWLANFYMNVYAHVRLDVKKERVEIKHIEQKVESKQNGRQRPAA